jgi:hypothetical protein
MLRSFVAAGLALLLLVGVTLAEKEKAKEKSAQVKGKIKKVDADKGVLTVTVGKGDEAKDVDFKISDDTKIMGPDRKPLEDGLKDKSLRAGADVTIFTDDKGKARGVLIGGKGETRPPKALPVFGKIKKVDADKGVLTVTVGTGGQAKDVDYEIGENTKIMTGTKQTPLEGGLKNKLVKAGTVVSIFTDDDGKVQGVLLVGGREPGTEIPGKVTPTVGKIKSVDAAKGVLTLTVTKGDQTKDMEFKITDETRIMGANGKPVKGGLKNEQFKAGATVSLYTDPEGKVAGLLIGQKDGPSTTVAKPHEARGKIKKVDAEKGVLTVTVGSKDVDYTINETTMIATGDKVELAGGLKHKSVKPGAEVTVYTDENGKVLGVLLGSLKDGGVKPPSIHEVKGTIKKVDAAKGVLIVSVGKGDGAKDEEFKVGADARFIGSDKKLLEDGIKDESVKAGTAVTLYTDEAGKVRGVQLGKKVKEEDKEKDKEKDKKEKDDK